MTHLKMTNFPLKTGRLVLLIAPFVLANNHTDSADTVFNLSDGWSIEAIAMLGALGLLILGRVATTCVTIEVQEVDRIEDPTPK